MMNSLMETAATVGGSRVKKGARLLLMMLTVHSKPNGQWKGPQSDLAKWTGYDVRSIPGLLQTLQDENTIEFDTPRRGPNKPSSPHHTVVQLTFAKGSSKRQAQPASPHGETSKVAQAVQAGPTLKPTTWQDKPKRARRRPKAEGPKTAELF